MEKPIVFLSHSAKNRREVTALKQLLDNKASGFVDFFLSSDGKSIPLGTNWVLALNEALKQTKLMFVFVSREALQSEWVLFEAGSAYGGDKHVVPYCLPGTELRHLPAPLRLLQAHTLHSAQDLATLARKCNEVFGTKIPERFSPAEFKAVFSKLRTPEEPTKDAAWETIVSEIKADVVGPPGGAESFRNLCRRKHLNPFGERSPHGAMWVGITASGMRLVEREEWFDDKTGTRVSGETKRRYEFTMSPTLFGVTAPVLDAWSKKLGKHVWFDVTVDFHFGVEIERQAHELTAKLFDSEVQVLQENWYGFRELRFSLFRRARYDDWTPQIRFCASGGIGNSQLPDLVHTLLIRKVLLLDDALAKELKKAK